MKMTTSIVLAAATCLAAFGIAPAQDEDPLLKKRRPDGAKPAADGRDPAAKYYERGESGLCTYEETVEKKPEPIQKRDGIVGKIDEITQMIQQSGAGKKTPKARWDFTVEPKLTLDDQGGGKVTLKVKENSWTLDPDLKPESASQCGMDRAGATEELKAWERPLTKEQVAAMEKGKIFRWKVDRPFWGFRLFKAPPIEVSVGLSVDKLRIGPVSVDYLMLEVRRHQLQEKARNAEEDVKFRAEKLDEEKKKVESKQAALAAEQAKLAPLAKARDAAFQKIRAAQPDEKAKSKACKDLEAKIAQAQKRQEHLFDLIVHIKDYTSNAPPDVLDNLLKEYDELTADLKKYQSDLEATPEWKKFKADKDALTKEVDGKKSELQQKDDAYYDQYKIVSHHRSDLDIETSLLDRATSLYEQSLWERDRAKEALDHFMLLKPPYLTLVEADSVRGGNVYYRGAFWNADDVLADLEKQIGQLRPQPALIRDQRDEAMRACWEALEACRRAQEAYSRAITESRVLQQLTEFGVFLYDAWDTGRSTGGFGIGVLMETGKKAVEWAIFGIPQPVDGSISLDGVELLKKQMIPRTVKTLGTGPAAKIVATSLMVSEARKEFEKKCEEWFATRAWANFGPSAGLSSAAPDAVANNAETAALLGARVKAIVDTGKVLAKAEKDSIDAVRNGVMNIEGKSFKEAAKDFWGWFKGVSPKEGPKNLKDWAFYKDGFIKGAMTKFLFGLAKDVAKSLAKQGIANYFENDAFLSCVEADLIFTKCAAVRYDLDYHLAAVEETLQFLKDSRDEILKQYDPKNHLKIKEDKEFKTSENLWVILQMDTETSKVLKDYELEVRLGGVRLERKSDAVLQYSAPSEALRAAERGAEGRAKLEVTLLAR